MKLSIITVTKNRPLQLINNAANSLLNQNSQEFEWIVVSDGKNPATEKAIEDFKVSADFPISYSTAESSQSEFGLCVGRVNFSDKRD
ncbi:MAG: glycosyltransferase family A protein [Waterburya sp.]